MELRLREGRPSETAWRTALARARHQLVDEGRVFRDPHAVDMLGPELASRLRTDPRHGSTLASRILSGAVVARSRIAEDTLAQAVAQGARQYVLLGAGLDTFAWRNPWPGQVRVFEVDHPATRAWRQERLQEAGLRVPDGVASVPVDFEREDFVAKLLAAGLHPDRPVVYAWLGVMVYLEPAAAWDTIRRIGAASPPGSALVFDYLRQPARWELSRRLGLALLARRYRRLGEPWRCLVREDELRERLARAGFAQVELLDASRAWQELREGRDPYSTRGVGPARGGRAGGIVRAWR